MRTWAKLYLRQARDEPVVNGVLLVRRQLSPRHPPSQCVQHLQEVEPVAPVGNLRLHHNFLYLDARARHPGHPQRRVHPQQQRGEVDGVDVGGRVRVELLPALCAWYFV